VSWHDSFDRMKQRPHILVVAPQAVSPAWGRVVEGADRGDFAAWAHQSAVAAWYADRHAGMFSMDMGTGKTFAAILALNATKLPLVYVNLCRGSGRQRAERLQAALSTASGKCLVVVVNYESVWRTQLAPTIEAVRWSAIVLDESHRIKAPGGVASRYLARLASKHPHARRLCLTGTPMPQSPLDLYGQFRFLDPQVFGTSFARMRARYAECDHRFPSKVKAWKNQAELAARLDAHSWRVTADEVLDLPEVIHEVLPVELSAATARFYRRLESDMVAEIEQGTVTANNVLTKLLRLQQATGGYAKVDATSLPVPIDGDPAKRMMLHDRLEDLPANEPVVVFCRFRTDLDDVAATARQLGREYAEVSGDSSRRGDLERWQRGDAVILGVQIQSGGVGIDCSRAAYAVYYSLGFSLGDYEQSLARLRRPGQTRCVRYYHLVCQGTVDEQVYAALRARRNVIDSVLQRLSPRKETVA
jgi:SNF2 family DNA or RNA helicase